MTREQVFAELEKRWRELYDQYEAVKASLPPVVRWEWANRPRYDPRPFHFLMNPPRGRVIKQQPQDDRQRVYQYEYGFDADGRVCVHRYYVFANHWETFYTYTADHIEIMTFGHYQGRYLMNELALCTMQKGRMQHYGGIKVNYYYIDPSLPYPAPGEVNRYVGEGLEKATAEQIWERLSNREHGIVHYNEDYVYERKRLTQIKLYSAWSTTGSWNANNDLRYDERSRLNRITQHVPLKNRMYRRVLYRKRNRGETLETLAEQAKTALIQAIPQIIAAARFDEPLYCLNLYYYRAKNGEYFPPELLPGLERDRQRKLQKYESDHVPGQVWWYLWEYDDEGNELTPRFDITDPAVLEACEPLDTEVNMRSRSDYAERVLYKISQALNQLDWSQYAPITPDFIVYTCDQTEHTDLEDSLRLSGATEAQINDWYERGLL
jgi:hypothetical protein